MDGEERQSGETINGERMKLQTCDNKKETISKYNNTETKLTILLGMSTTNCCWAEYQGGQSLAIKESWLYDQVV